METIENGVTAAEWTAAWDRVVCPVAREFFSHFTGPMSPVQGSRFRRFCTDIKVLRAKRETEYARAMRLADFAVRRAVPHALDAAGRGDLAKVVRAWQPIRTHEDMDRADRAFAVKPIYGITEVSDIAGSIGMSTYILHTGRLFGRREDRLWVARVAGQAMQAAGAWDEGMSAMWSVVDPWSGRVESGDATAHDARSSALRQTARTIRARGAGGGA